MPAETRVLVLLHPFPMDASFWGPTWRALEIDAQLVTPEFPGFGAAPPVEHPTVDAFADEVAELIRDQGPDGALVVGLSLGGYVALSLVARHPDVVSGLVLANTKASADDPDAKRARDHGIDTIRIDGLTTYLDGLLPRLVSPGATGDTWERMAAIAERQDPEAVCAALEALRDRPDRTESLGTIGIPTLVVVGADDVVTPPALAEAMADAIPGARLVRIDGAGHLSALEQPEAFATAIRDLAGRVWSRT